jgi:hypothetical protein
MLAQEKRLKYGTIAPSVYSVEALRLASATYEAAERHVFPSSSHPSVCGFRQEVRAPDMEMMGLDMDMPDWP